MIREWKKMWVTAFMSAGTRAAFCDSYRASASFMRELFRSRPLELISPLPCVIIIPHGDAGQPGL